MKIDVHAHCYPQLYLSELIKLGMGEDGAIGMTMPPWSSAEERIAEMDKAGIDIQVLALSTPNVYFPDAGLSLDLAQMTNDFIASLCHRYPERFMGAASIPLNNVDYAMGELSRAIDRLGMHAVVLGTNVNEKSLGDDQFLSILGEIDSRGIPVILHPMKAIGENLMPPEHVTLTLPSSVGFIFETTRTVAEMTFKGTFELYKNLTFILPHSGGAVPFIYPRWDMVYFSRSKDHPLRKLPLPPSHYLKRHYYDTALSYSPSTLRCTLDLAGVDHLVFGTDWPYTKGTRAREAMESIDSLDLSDEEKEKIYSLNAMTLFPRIENYPRKDTLAGIYLTNKIRNIGGAE